MKKKIFYAVLFMMATLFQMSCGDDTLVTGISLSQQDMNLRVGESETLIATVYPSDADNPVVTWTSSNVSVASVDQTGKVTAVAGGTSTISCRATDGSGVYAECKVTVDAHEWVDLGLPSGTLWATCNVGANSPEEYGDYFAWGETSAKSIYNWGTYKYCKGSDDTYTKYCRRSSEGYNGFVDNMTELDPADDAATANWGSGWQMPSMDQIEELINSEYTTTEWTTQDGVNGRKITSRRNVRSIFLPAAGYRDGTSLYDAGSNGEGNYWSRSLSYYSDGYNLWFASGPYNIDCGDDGGFRCRGLSVRPVRVK